MLISDMLKELDAIQPKLEAINDALKYLPRRDRENRWENLWTAHTVSGSMVTSCKMLRTCLLRAQAEGHQ